MKTPFPILACLLLALYLAGCADSQTDQTAMFERAEPANYSRIHNPNGGPITIKVYFDNTPRDMRVQSEPNPFGARVSEWYVKNKVLTLIVYCPSVTKLGILLQWDSGSKPLRYYGSRYRIR